MRVRPLQIPETLSWEYISRDRQRSDKFLAAWNTLDREVL